jgi:hypothetical protein
VGPSIPLSACLSYTWAPPWEIQFIVCDSATTPLDLTPLVAPQSTAGLALLLPLPLQRQQPRVLHFLSLAPATLFSTAPACVLPAEAAALLQTRQAGSLQLTNSIENIPSPIDNSTLGGIVSLSNLVWQWSTQFTPGTDNSYPSPLASLLVPPIAGFTEYFQLSPPGSLPLPAPPLPSPSPSPAPTPAPPAPPLTTEGLPQHYFPLRTPPAPCSLLPGLTAPSQCSSTCGSQPGYALRFQPVGQLDSTSPPSGPCPSVGARPLKQQVLPCTPSEACSGCFSQARDGGESDIDCGGGGGCKRCVSGFSCQKTEDCGVGLSCAAPTLGLGRCAPNDLLARNISVWVTVSFTASLTGPQQLTQATYAHLRQLSADAVGGAPLSDAFICGVSAFQDASATVFTKVKVCLVPSGEGQQRQRQRLLEVAVGPTGEAAFLAALADAGTLRKQSGGMAVAAADIFRLSSPAIGVAAVTEIGATTFFLQDGGLGGLLPPGAPPTPEGRKQLSTEQIVGVALGGVVLLGLCVLLAVLLWRGRKAGSGGEAHLPQAEEVEEQQQPEALDWGASGTVQKEHHKSAFKPKGVKIEKHSKRESEDSGDTSLSPEAQVDGEVVGGQSLGDGVVQAEAAEPSATQVPVEASAAT